MRHLTIALVQRCLALMGFTELGDVGGVAEDEIHVGSSALKSQDQTSGVLWVWNDMVALDTESAKVLMFGHSAGG